MSNITIDDLETVLSYDIRKHKTCIEIAFSINDSPIYTSCYMGKLITRQGEEIYWLGLTADGNQGYDFTSVESMLNVKVVEGKSLKEVWERLIFHTIDSHVAESRLAYYKRRK